MPGIAVVVNPYACGNRGAAGRAVRLGSIVGVDGWVRETESLAHAAEVAQECRQRAADIVALCGGDGTVGRSLSAMVRAYHGAPLPCVLLLRTGTMNTIARALGCPSWQPERVLADVVNQYRWGRPLKVVECQLLSINGTAHGFMVGIGVPVSFLHMYYRQRRHGSLAAARLLLTLAGSALSSGTLVRELFQWMDARVLGDGIPAPFSRYSVIYASSIEDIGLGFRPTYRAREQPGSFQVFAGPLDARELLRCLGKIRRGVATGSRQVYDALVRRLVVEFRQPNSYMVDGEVMEPASRLVLDGGPVVRVVRR